ncbi:MAG: diaminopimelate epimerase [Ignavibacteriales bacterium]|nr:diaminopimelate epimerase [Ignavibacteriales bacterium]
MKLQLPFTKLSGAGNDFVLIDNRGGEYNLPWEKVAQQICQLHFGIGADGLLVLEDSKKYDFEMKYFNSDGSYGGMCGNGGRCAAYYYFLNDNESNLVHFESIGKEYVAEETHHTIRLKMNDVNVLPTLYSPTINKIKYKIYFLDVGSPHAVLFFEDKKNRLETFPVEDIGRKVRSHKLFSPRGTNVDFVQRVNDTTIALRTFERGVEAETLACGTGSVASALVSSQIWKMRSPIHVIPKSNQKLSIHFQFVNERFVEVWLEGPASVIFKGIFCYDIRQNRLIDFPQ